MERAPIYFAFAVCGFLILKGLMGIIRQDIRLKRRHEVGPRAIWAGFFLIAIGCLIIVQLVTTLQNPAAFAH